MKRLVINENDEEMLKIFKVMVYRKLIGERKRTIDFEYRYIYAKNEKIRDSETLYIKCNLCTGNSICKTSKSVNHCELIDLSDKSIKYIAKNLTKFFTDSCTFLKKENKK
jgi:hypothetical protein